MSTQPCAASTEEMLSVYNQLRRDFSERQNKWLKFYSAVNVLHIINTIIIVSSFIFGFFSAKENASDTLNFISIMATIVAFGFVGVFGFTLLWEIVFTFVRLGKRSSLSKLLKKLEDAFVIKASIVSQMALKPSLAEKDPKLIEAFSNKKNRWIEVESELYQGQCLYLKMHLKKMRLVEWQWMKYSFIFAASIASAILAIYALAIIIVLILVWAYLTSGNKHRDNSYNTPCYDEPKFDEGPSKYTLLLEEIDKLQAYLVKKQHSTEKIKDSLRNWGVPNAQLFRNEELLIPLKQTKKRNNKQNSPMS